jgi:hypothetical protein
MLQICACIIVPINKRQNKTLSSYYYSFLQRMGNVSLPTRVKRTITKIVTMRSDSDILTMNIVSLSMLASYAKVFS